MGKYSHGCVFISGGNRNTQESMSTEETEPDVRVETRNIGGIDETEVGFSSGVTVLVGRNATNRTSFLQALMAALGSKQVSIKGDANEGYVELLNHGKRYTRRLIRQGNQIQTEGNPYMEDATLADLFAFLLESNESRRSVAQNADLRDLVIRPIDTEKIQAEIEQYIERRDQLEQDLDEIDALKGKLPDLEAERSRLQEEIEAKQDELTAKEAEIESEELTVEQHREQQEAVEELLSELQTKRSRLEDARYNLETRQESLRKLEGEKSDLETKKANLPDAPVGELDEIETEIERLRSRKQTLESELNELHNVISFNEELLEDADHQVFDALETKSQDAVTDQLLTSNTVRCWTCGSTVERDQIEATVETLRDLSQETLSDIKGLGDGLSELKERRKDLRQQQRQREDIDQKLQRIESDIRKSESAIDRLRDQRDELTDEIEALEEDLNDVEGDAFSDVLDLHKEANQLEYEIGRLESEREQTEEEITEIDRQLDKRDDLEEQREQVQDEIVDLRTRIDRIEQEVVEEFNDHMDTVLQLLDYANLDRIWIERIKDHERKSRQKTPQTTFKLHVIRTTGSGTTYEDTIDHLSESEREVTGLVFALAGYLAHDVHEEVPFILLDSLEAIDSDRIARLIEYLQEYSEYLVVALLPEDAAALSDNCERINKI